MILTVGPGVTELICPTPTCQLPQMLPSELMTITASLPPPTTTNTSSTRGVMVPSPSRHLQNVNAKARAGSRHRSD